MYRRKFPREAAVQITGSLVHNFIRLLVGIRISIAIFVGHIAFACIDIQTIKTSSERIIFLWIVPMVPSDNEPLFEPCYSNV